AQPHFAQRSQTPPPTTIHEAERGRKTGLVPLSFGGGFLLLLPLSASGRGPGGGVLRADRSGRVVLTSEYRDGTPQVLQAAQQRARQHRVNTDIARQNDPVNGRTLSPVRLQRYKDGDQCGTLQRHLDLAQPVRP